VTDEINDAAEPGEEDAAVTAPDAEAGAEDSSDDSSGDSSGDNADESSEESTGEGTFAGGAPDRLKVLEREGDIAADYLEELLDIADLDGDLDMDVEGDRASVSIVGADLSQLVGRNGEVLEALQELTRLAVLRETGERSRLMLDIGGHRAERRAVLEGVARDAVDQAKSSGEPVSLKPMTPFERKVVHDVVAAAGLGSDSEGVEPRRYVVVRPA
jgi:spoIIIJ-associated protein